ncbi:uncharacterized protein LOC116013236 [Ipomoea triloba]|uniref:uncharacterized protein LOC116013236 n=1 Tax=Ipomoea triloba TaxID=35885 RepID=UPI00125D9BEC|nr:uncharacterized protein LOC116013236 [Ipomoea triloba]
MAPYEALYGQKCRSPLCWSDRSDVVILGPQYLQETTEAIKVIQGRMKAAQDRQKSYADLKRQFVEYQRYVPDTSHVLEPEELEMDDSLAYEERPICVLDSKTRDTRRKSIKMIKVQWSNHSPEEATWELEDDMMARYPELFDSAGESSKLS